MNNTPKLTKKDTLYYCYQMWKLIAEGATKEDACKTILSLHKLEIPYILNNCFCCEYIRIDNLLNCNKCPMLTCWKGRNYDFPCENSSKSPYKKWLYSLQQDTSYAKQISDFALNLYNKK